jgi:hypothetical protein
VVIVSGMPWRRIVYLTDEPALSPSAYGRQLIRAEHRLKLCKPTQVCHNRAIDHPEPDEMERRTHQAIAHLRGWWEETSRLLPHCL